MKTAFKKVRLALTYAIIVVACMFVFSACNDSDEKTATEGLVFVLDEKNDSYTVADYTGTEIDVYIPPIYDGTPVTSIGENAFRYRGGLKSVSIPDSVTSIEKYAFADCGSLTSITIPDSVTSIDADAFDGCPIENISMPANAIDSIPKDNLKQVKITKGKALNSSAFYGCANLTSVTLPDGVGIPNLHPFKNNGVF